jgi:transcriptional regulator of acetoin/glycerol metabolism
VVVHPFRACFVCRHRGSANRRVPLRAGAKSRYDKDSVAEEYAKKLREEVVRALTACKGHVGGADGVPARLGADRTTLHSQMKKLGIYAKQYA